MKCIKDCKDWGLLLLRLAVAFPLLWHGFPKAADPALAMTKFAGMGLPGFLGPVVGVAEVIAGILIVIGLWHKWANIAMFLVIGFATLWVHLSRVDAGLERNLLMLAAFLVLICHGTGKFSVKKEACCT